MDFSHFVVCLLFVFLGRLYTSVIISSFVFFLQFLGLVYISIQMKYCIQYPLYGQSCGHEFFQPIFITDRLFSFSSMADNLSGNCSLGWHGESFRTWQHCSSICQLSKFPWEIICCYDGFSFIYNFYFFLLQLSILFLCSVCFMF